VLAEGQLSHVGACYALEDNGHPLRILVVPKQVGGSLEHGKGRGDEHVTVAARSEQVDSAKYGPRPHPRTVHMDGTALALKVLLGMRPDGSEDLDVGGQSRHVFDCFAMANATLCSRVGTDASGQGSDAMFANCVSHLQRTIEILTPNVIIAQGWTSTGWSPTRAVAKALTQHKPAKNSCTKIPTSNGPIAFVAAVHPARNWSSPTSPRWPDVQIALDEARQIALA